MKESIVKLICMAIGIAFWKIFGFEIVVISLLSLIWGTLIILESEK